MNKIVVTGKTIEEAVKSGLASWNTTEDRVRIRVLEQPSKGLFGWIGTKDAKVELEKIPDPLEETEKFLHEVFQAMKIDVTLESLPDNEGYRIDLRGKELGILIGRRGQTLDALQYLANIVANRYSSTHLRIALDAENFRERRKKTLEDLAVKLASRVVRTQKEVVLEPMPPQERKVIHSRLQNHSQVKTSSRGEEPNRRIVISLK
jgi:spoIIIJ-associated protein